mmetsp:Transcript_15063/g.43755  ORF Transcript_15063/g.43755 Transcript_15063/m.43755 type:complete len:82 (+) Transcript_15063:2532-2777(+)
MLKLVPTHTLKQVHPLVEVSNNQPKQRHAVYCSIGHCNKKASLGHIIVGGLILPWSLRHIAQQSTTYCAAEQSRTPIAVGL